jgi:hypothetical protein
LRRATSGENFMALSRGINTSSLIPTSKSTAPSSLQQHQQQQHTTTDHTAAGWHLLGERPSSNCKYTSPRDGMWLTAAVCLQMLQICTAWKCLLAFHCICFLTIGLPLTSADAPAEASPPRTAQNV